MCCQQAAGQSYNGVSATKHDITVGSLLRQPSHHYAHASNKDKHADQPCRGNLAYLLTDLVSVCSSGDMK